MADEKHVEGGGEYASDGENTTETYFPRSPNLASLSNNAAAASQLFGDDSDEEMLLAPSSSSAAAALSSSGAAAAPPPPPVSNARPRAVFDDDTDDEEFLQFASRPRVEPESDDEKPLETYVPPPPPPPTDEELLAAVAMATEAAQRSAPAAQRPWCFNADLQDAPLLGTVGAWLSQDDPAFEAAIDAMQRCYGREVPCHLLPHTTLANCFTRQPAMEGWRVDKPPDAGAVYMPIVAAANAHRDLVARFHDLKSPLFNARVQDLSSSRFHADYARLRRRVVHRGSRVRSEVAAIPIAVWRGALTLQQAAHVVKVTRQSLSQVYFEAARSQPVVIGLDKAGTLRRLFFYAGFGEHRADDHDDATVLPCDFKMHPEVPLSDAAEHVLTGPQIRIHRLAVYINFLAMLQTIFCGTMDSEGAQQIYAMTAAHEANPFRKSAPDLKVELPEANGGAKQRPDEATRDAALLAMQRVGPPPLLCVLEGDAGLLSGEPPKLAVTTDPRIGSYNQAVQTLYAQCRVDPSYAFSYVANFLHTMHQIRRALRWLPTGVSNAQRPTWRDLITREAKVGAELDMGRLPATMPLEQQALLHEILEKRTSLSNQEVGPPLLTAVDEFFRRWHITNPPPNTHHPIVHLVRTLPSDAADTQYPLSSVAAVQSWLWVQDADAKRGALATRSIRQMLGGYDLGSHSVWPEVFVFRPLIGLSPAGMSPKTRMLCFFTLAHCVRQAPLPVRIALSMFEDASLQQWRAQAMVDATGEGDDLRCAARTFFVLCASAGASVGAFTLPVPEATAVGQPSDAALKWLRAGEGAANAELRGVVKPFELPTSVFQATVRRPEELVCAGFLFLRGWQHLDPLEFFDLYDEPRLHIGAQWCLCTAARLELSGFHVKNLENIDVAMLPQTYAVPDALRTRLETRFSLTDGVNTDASYRWAKGWLVASDGACKIVSRAGVPETLRPREAIRLTVSMQAYIQERKLRVQTMQVSDAAPLQTRLAALLKIDAATLARVVYKPLYTCADEFFIAILLAMRNLILTAKERNASVPLPTAADLNTWFANMEEAFRNKLRTTPPSFDATPAMHAIETSAFVLALRRLRERMPEWCATTTQAASVVRADAHAALAVDESWQTKHCVALATACFCHVAAHAHRTHNDALAIPVILSSLFDWLQQVAIRARPDEHADEIAALQAFPQCFFIPRRIEAWRPSQQLPLKRTVALSAAEFLAILYKQVAGNVAFISDSSVLDVVNRLDKPFVWNSDVITTDPRELIKARFGRHNKATTPWHYLFGQPETNARASTGVAHRIASSDLGSTNEFEHIDVVSGGEGLALRVQQLTEPALAPMLIIAHMRDDAFRMDSLGPSCVLSRCAHRYTLFFAEETDGTLHATDYKTARIFATTESDVGLYKCKTYDAKGDGVDETWQTVWQRERMVRTAVFIRQERPAPRRSMESYQPFSHQPLSSVILSVHSPASEIKEVAVFMEAAVSAFEADGDAKMDAAEDVPQTETTTEQRTVAGILQQRILHPSTAFSNGGMSQRNFGDLVAFARSAASAAQAGAPATYLLPVPKGDKLTFAELRHYINALAARAPKTSESTKKLIKLYNPAQAPVAELKDRAHRRAAARFQPLGARLAVPVAAEEKLARRRPAEETRLLPVGLLSGTPINTAFAVSRGSGEPLHETRGRRVERIAPALPPYKLRDASVAETKQSDAARVAFLQTSEAVYGQLPAPLPTTHDPAVETPEFAPQALEADTELQIERLAQFAWFKHQEWSKPCELNGEKIPRFLALPVWLSKQKYDRTLASALHGTDLAAGKLNQMVFFSQPLSAYTQAVATAVKLCTSGTGSNVCLCLMIAADNPRPNAEYFPNDMRDEARALVTGFLAQFRYTNERDFRAACPDFGRCFGDDEPAPGTALPDLQLLRNLVPSVAAVHIEFTEEKMTHGAVARIGLARLQQFVLVMHFEGSDTKTPLRVFFSAPLFGDHTCRPNLMTAHEQKFANTNIYTGCDFLVSAFVPTRLHGQASQPLYKATRVFRALKTEVKEEPASSDEAMRMRDNCVAAGMLPPFIAADETDSEEKRQREQLYLGADLTALPVVRSLIDNDKELDVRRDGDASMYKVIGQKLTQSSTGVNTKAGLDCSTDHTRAGVLCVHTGAPDEKFLVRQLFNRIEHTALTDTDALRQRAPYAMYRPATHTYKEVKNHADECTRHDAIVAENGAPAALGRVVPRAQRFLLTANDKHAPHLICAVQPTVRLVFSYVAPRSHYLPVAEAREEIDRDVYRLSPDGVPFVTQPVVPGCERSGCYFFNHAMPFCSPGLSKHVFKIADETDEERLAMSVADLAHAPLSLPPMFAHGGSTPVRLSFHSATPPMVLNSFTGDTRVFPTGPRLHLTDTDVDVGGCVHFVAGALLDGRLSQLLGDRVREALLSQLFDMVTLETCLAATGYHIMQRRRLFWKQIRRSRSALLGLLTADAPPTTTTDWNKAVGADQVGVLDDADTDVERADPLSDWEPWHHFFSKCLFTEYGRDGAPAEYLPCMSVDIKAQWDPQRCALALQTFAESVLTLSQTAACADVFQPYSPQQARLYYAKICEAMRLLAAFLKRQLLSIANMLEARFSQWSTPSGFEHDVASMETARRPMLKTAQEGVDVFWIAVCRWLFSVTAGVAKGLQPAGDKALAFCRGPTKGSGLLSAIAVCDMVRGLDALVQGYYAGFVTGVPSPYVDYALVCTHTGLTHDTQRDDLGSYADSMFGMGFLRPSVLHALRASGCVFHPKLLDEPNGHDFTENPALFCRMLWPQLQRFPLAFGADTDASVFSAAAVALDKLTTVLVNKSPHCEVTAARSTEDDFLTITLSAIEPEVAAFARSLEGQWIEDLSVQTMNDDMKVEAKAQMSQEILVNLLDVCLLVCHLTAPSLTQQRTFVRTKGRPHSLFADPAVYAAQILLLRPAYAALVGLTRATGLFVTLRTELQGADYGLLGLSFACFLQLHTFCSRMAETAALYGTIGHDAASFPQGFAVGVQSAIGTCYQLWRAFARAYADLHTDVAAYFNTRMLDEDRAPRYDALGCLRIRDDAVVALRALHLEKKAEGDWPLHFTGIVTDLVAGPPGSPLSLETSFDDGNRIAGIETQPI